MSNYNTLDVKSSGDHIFIVKLNRPDNANAINTEMARELESLFAQLNIDQGPHRCVILTGAGKKIFSAGGDLKERNSMNDEQWLAQHSIIERVILNMLDCPVPIIAAVNGAAVGGGSELALNCDFIYAVDHAYFALPEVGLGIIPGAGGTQNLPRAIGQRRAKEIIFTGKSFTAEQALEWGMLNEIFPPDELMISVIDTAEKIAANAPLAIRQAKKSIALGTQMDLRTALYFEIEAYNKLVSSEDRYEGVRAFNEKRNPVFKGK